MFSSLALTASGGDDGFLIALDVFGRTIPADLVVRSACETGKGRIVRGEGILGLTRAFMFASAPRVTGSLWKVDDEATRTLMVSFYELWDPRDGSKPLGTAAALRAAQDPVRTQAKWKHPYSWPRGCCGAFRTRLRLEQGGASGSRPRREPPGGRGSDRRSPLRDRGRAGGPSVRPLGRQFTPKSTGPERDSTMPALATTISTSCDPADRLRSTDPTNAPATTVWTTPSTRTVVWAMSEVGTV